ncbi:hypothetical protein [Phytoactinopolyspora limicola]|uniref:hypothetical protein n=1 Tax=Phytoactinopolyspora limicola TaxID=2715536 RepID=UPI00140B0EA6|nr:hypothetical protein [Phytoactinopolyspora limicola]
MATTAHPTTTVGRRRVLHVGSAGMILGGLLVAVGSLLPWVATPAGSLSGVAGGGLWTLCAGMIAIAGALLPFRRLALAHAALPGIIAAGIVGWQLVRLAELSAVTGSWGKLLPGVGLVMVGGGAVFLLRSAFRIRSAGVATTP